ncbi:MAG TPA: hypothetical protein VKB39_02050 [Candidatus Baltobacteraceae bacterium]|nr:hypothetical protein [Candidatus Baltobacteraceae bacterium]
MRSLIAVFGFLIAVTSLPACGAVRQTEQGFASGFHKGFRTSLRASFIKSCTAQSGGNEATCACVIDTLERNSTDEQLMKLQDSDAEATKAISAAARDCTNPQTASRDATDHIAIYVTPYYNSAGPIVHVGQYSAGLASHDERSVVTTIRRMKQHWNALRFYELYVGAIRLYDLGYRNEAVYWFYTAQYRGRLFGMLADPKRLGTIGDPGFELYHAQNAFFELTGPAINGYAFGDVDRLAGVLQRVERENRAVPDVHALYPGVAFIPKDSWAAKNADLTAGLAKLASTLSTQKVQIASQREQNGTAARFANVASKDLPTL